MVTIDLDLFITSLLSQTPLVALTVVVLYLLLSHKIDMLRQEFRYELSTVRYEISTIKRSISCLVDFGDALITVLQSKGLLSNGEVHVLRTYLRTVTPTASSRYYTEEVRRRLLELLDKPLDEYTWEDVYELEKIAELMFREGCETGRDDLVSYSGKLRFFIAVLKGTLLRKGKLPKQ